MFLGLILIFLGIVIFKDAKLCQWDHCTDFTGYSNLVGWMFIFIAFCFIWLDIRKWIKKKKAPKKPNDEIEEEKWFICLHCYEPFLDDKSGKQLLCPKCGSTDFEELIGFYERHPEKKNEP
jgi:hypothetical protein